MKLVVFKGTGRAALVTMAASNITFGKRGVKSKSSTIERVMYWLVKSVTQKPDPTVLPNDQAIAGAARLAVGEVVKSITERRAS